MSKQTSLLTFEGKMGNLSFFKSKGEYRARLRGGISKERMLNDPNLSRVRENLSEFSAIALAGKSFRRALAKVKNFQDGALSQRLSKIFTVIKKRSLTVRGQRPILLSQHRSLVAGLELNSTQNLMDVLNAPFTSSHDNVRNLAYIEVQITKASEMITPPPSATHFRLVQLLGFVSDTVYDDTTNSYQAVNEVLNGQHEISLSEYLPVNSTAHLITGLSTSINATPTADITVIQGLGIIFYENIGSEYYALAQGKAMRIVDVF